MNGLRAIIGVITGFQSLPFGWYWGLLTVGLVSTFLVLQQYTQHQLAGYDFAFSWLPLYVKYGLGFGLWFLLLPGINRLSQLITIRPILISRLVGILAVALLVIGLHRILSTRLNDLYGLIQYGYLRSFMGSNSLLELGIGFFSSSLEFLVILIVLIMLNTQYTLLDKQRELARAELNALKMQLNPHFLFNTLHSVSALIDIDIKKAQEMIARLGDLLRKVLEADHTQMTTLEAEMDFIQEYMEIEKIRHEHLKVNFNMEGAIGQLPVPTFILQPLAENAIKHGLHQNESPTEIRISADLKADKLVLEVENEYVKTDNSGTGLGISNVGKRLAQLYSDFNLDILRSDESFLVRITIPSS